MVSIPLSTFENKSPVVGRYHAWNVTGNPITGTYSANSARSKGYKFSLNHKRSSDGKYREGGPFMSLVFRTSLGSSLVDKIYRINYGVAYDGIFVPAFGSAQYDYSWSSLYGVNDTAIAYNAAFVYGSQAYERLRPDKPDYSPLVGILETLHELPGILEAFSKFNKRYHAELARKRASGIFLSRSGKYHLAIQFGIMPIISDIKSFLKAYRGANKRFAQLLRDEGRWIRRRANLDKVGDIGPNGEEEYQTMWSTTHTSANNPNVLPALVSQCYGGGQAVSGEVRHFSREVWCVGKSRYWLPDLHQRDGKWMKRLHREIYSGGPLNIEDIYNLIPWSWLFDYFSSLGHFFGAIADGLAESVVFDYAYIMRKVTERSRASCTSFVYKSPTTTGQVTSYLYRDCTLKTRVTASLFGFGMSEQDLSPFQLAILGALGLSRL